MGKKKVKALKIPKTVQDSIPYVAVYPRGIIEIEPHVFCHMYRLQDINFACAKDVEQQELFENYCRLLNMFDPSVRFQITEINHAISKTSFESDVLLKHENDGLDNFRDEENTMLRNKMEEGRNNLVSDRFLTISVEAESAAAASVLFSRYDSEVVATARRIGRCVCDVLTSTEMLRVLYDIYNRGHEDDFASKTQIDPTTKRNEFDFDNMRRLGLTTKDVIGPEGMEFRKDYFMLGDTYGRVEYLSQIPSALAVSFFPELCGLGFSMISSIQFEGMPNEKAIRKSRDRLTSINANVVDAQKRAARAGYSGDLISADLKLNQQEANELLSDLQTRNQKLFEVTMTFAHFADSKEELNRQTELIKTTARKALVSISTMLFQQEAGFATTLPLCNNQVAIKRSLTTEAAAVFIPFNAQELSQQNGMYYGVNAISHNLILYNRLTSKNGNGWVFGTPGSGKSFISKAEMMQVMLTTNDDIIILDPEREFFPLAAQLNKYSTAGNVAKVIRIAPGSKHFINPMDLPMYDNDEEAEDPMSNHLSYILGLCQLMFGRFAMPLGCESLVDRAMQAIYGPYLKTLDAGHPDERLIPTLSDLYAELNKYPEPAAHDLALQMETYCSPTGSQNMFAHRTVKDDDDDHTRMTIYDVKDVGQSLKSIAMLVVTNQIWNRLCLNRIKGRRTWIYLDEIYLLFKDQNSAEFLRNLFKRARKYGGIPTAITQNVEDLLTNDTVRTMLSNSEYICMLNQAPLDRASLATLLNLSDTQLSYVTNADPGCGLLSVEKSLVPFTNQYPKNSMLFRMMNTNLSEMTEEDLKMLEEERKSY